MVLPTGAEEAEALKAMAGTVAEASADMGLQLLQQQPMATTVQIGLPLQQLQVLLVVKQPLIQL